MKETITIQKTVTPLSITLDGEATGTFDSIIAVVKERMEQIYKHGRTIEDDCNYNNKSQLSTAAARLLHDTDACPIGWSEEIWSKMIAKSYEERVTIAAALLLAELDRLNQNKNQLS